MERENTPIKTWKEKKRIIQVMLCTGIFVPSLPSASRGHWFPSPVASPPSVPPSPPGWPPPQSPRRWWCLQAPGSQAVVSCERPTSQLTASPRARWQRQQTQSLHWSARCGWASQTVGAECDLSPSSPHNKGALRKTLYLYLYNLILYKMRPATGNREAHCNYQN